MSLFGRRRGQRGETPEQTLARLNAASSATAAPIPPAGPATAPRFTVTHKRNSGYAIAEVESFVGTIDQRSVEEIQNVLFHTSRTKGGGYDEDEVDRFLDEQVAQREATLTAPPPADSNPLS